MIGMFIFVVVIGWVVGVHMPWQGIVVIYVAALVWAYKNTDGLEGVLEGIIVIFFLGVLTFSGFINSSVTVSDIGSWLGYLFTGVSP